jgi:hypothetical protein
LYKIWEARERTNPTSGGSTEVALTSALMLTAMRAIYLGDALALPKNTAVELFLDDQVFRVESLDQVFTFPRAPLKASLENRLLFDPTTRRPRPHAFIINMTELRGEAHLRRTLHIESPRGALWFLTDDDAAIVSMLKGSTNIGEEQPTSLRPTRTLLSILILALVALTIAVISTRLNLH